MSFLKDLKRGKKKEQEPDEREPGKTFRKGELKRRRGIRRTSVSSNVFGFTSIALSVLIGLGVIGVVGYVGYYLFNLVMNW